MFHFPSFSLFLLSSLEKDQHKHLVLPFRTKRSLLMLTTLLPLCSHFFPLSTLAVPWPNLQTLPSGAPRLVWELTAIWNTCFPKILRPKVSPSSFQEGAALREGRQEFPGHTKVYFAHKGYLPSQPSQSLPGWLWKSRAGTAFWFTAWQIYPSLLLAPQATCHQAGERPLCQGRESRKRCVCRREAEETVWGFLQRGEERGGV